MPLPYRRSTYQQPIKQAPPLPSTPAELEALMERELGPRAPKSEYAPVPAVVARSCRFHPRVWSCAAVFRGDLGQEDGWVLLCSACVRALDDETLEVLDTAGRYRGSIPAPAVAPHPFVRR